MTASLIAYHGDKQLKARTLRKVREHRKADRIIQGLYWAKQDDGVFRGCAVGCLLEDPTGAHERYETEFGIPELLAHLEDGIFEALPPELAKDWPGRFMGAIRVGADLSRIWPQFAIWLMIDSQKGETQ